MSIVKMKRLRLIALAGQREELLSRLLHVGCVELSEPQAELADPEWTKLLRRSESSLTDVKQDLAHIASALQALNKYSPAKGGLFRKRESIKEEDFLSGQAVKLALDKAGEINRREHELATIQSQETRLTTRILSLTPWSSLDVDLAVPSTQNVKINFSVCPAGVDMSALRAELSQAASTAEVIEASADREQHYFLWLCHGTEEAEAHAALRNFGVSPAGIKGYQGTAAENIAAAQAEMETMAQRRAVLEEEIAGMADCRGSLEVCTDRLNQEASKEECAQHALTDGTIVFFTGWAAATGLPALEKELAKFVCAYELADPAEGETPPTQLQNPKWMQCMNMVTEMYSLPAYHGIDPNPLIFFFFIFFFGFMFADVAYGVILFIISFAITRMFKPKKTMGYMFQLGRYLGISTAFCGIFVGGFFGNVLEVIYNTFLPGAVMPGWMASFCAGIVVNPVNDPMTVLVIAVCIGAVHLVFGQVVRIYMGFRDGEAVDGLLDVVPWWCLFATIGMVAAGLPWWWIIIGCLILVFTQGRHKKGIFGKLFGGIASLYDITSWLSDILSYARLMALMLATSVIAQVFNTLGSLGGRTVVGIILFVVVFLIGHVFNIGVNLIGTYVHAARLQYLEFFGKFYKEGGIPFRPLKYDTKYVDIIEEEK